VLVRGSGGNSHALSGKPFTVGKTEAGQFIITVTGEGVLLTHPQHKPPIHLTKGIYLIDRAREKGMFTDMVAPVAD